MIQPQLGTRLLSFSKWTNKSIKTILFLPFYFLLLTNLVSLPLWFNVAVAQAQLPSGLKKAFSLLGQGRVNDAIAIFQQYLQRDPQSLPAKLGLGISYRRAGRDADAWATYQSVIAQDPSNQLALKTIGFLGSYRPQWQAKGIQALTTLLNLQPNDSEARAQRALLYGYQSKFSESLADYQQVLQSNPTADVVLGAAQIYTYSGDSGQALALFNRYRETGKPLTGYAAVAYGRTLRETGNPLAAIEYLENIVQRAKSLNEVSILARAELSQAYSANQQSTQALAVLEPLQGRQDAILPLARSLNAIRTATNAPNLAAQIDSLYRQALTNTPNPSPTLLREVADIYSGLPQGQQIALPIYRQLAAQNPNDKALLVQQLALESQLGTISKAELKQRLLTALQSLPTDRVQLQKLGQALVKVDIPEPDLLPVYQNLLQSGVNEPFLNFRLAQIFIRRQDFASARRALAAYTATPQGAKDLAPQLLAAEIERREGNLEASAQRYLALIANMPDSNDISNAALRGLAGVRLQQKQPDAALTVYDQLIARNPQDATIQLGRASIAYQAKRLSEPQAEAILNNWLATQPAANTPPELYSLVAALPANPQREALYTALVDADPSNVGVQVLLVKAIAQRSPTLARRRVKQLIARIPNTTDSALIQGQLSQAIGDLNPASRAYERVLAKEPENVDALSALGGVRFQQKRFDTARQIYTQVLEVKPEDREARRSVAGLRAISDQPLLALEELEKLQMSEIAKGGADPEVSRQMQQLQEDFLLRRGFQPSWEDYQRRESR